MKGFHRYISHFFEVLVIVLVIVGIVVGLEAIGIFSFSELLPWTDGENSDIRHENIYDDDDIYKALSEGKSSETISVVSNLSREHVIRLLEDVSVSNNYYQELNVTVIDDNGKTLDSKATVSHKDNKYDVSLYSSGGNIYKRITEKEEDIELSYFDNAGNETKTTLVKGSFDIQSDTGIIITHDRFFSENASYEPDEEFYSVAYSDFGSVLFFEFVTEFDGFSQVENYWLSLDYGVVMRAECYENEKLVYVLETISLNNDI